MAKKKTIKPSVRINNDDHDDETAGLLNNNGGSSSSSRRRGGGDNVEGGGMMMCCRRFMRGCCSSLSSCCSSTTGGSSNTNMDRFVLLVLLSCFVVIAVYYQFEIFGLRQAVHKSQDQVTKITNLLGLHESVIERFNSSVTNTDVMSRLSSLETNLSVTTSRVQHQLEKVSIDISNQLNETLEQLSQTVSEAEDTISKEVEKVKSDVNEYVITTQAQFSMENSFMIYQLAGTFTVLSCLISMWHMTAHLRKMNQPDVQRKILAILWMSPIYAVTSWFSLVFHSAEGYLAIIKDFYEAYIIYQFLAFLIAVLGKGDRNAVVDLLAKHADHLTPPFRLCGCFEICGWCKPEPYESNRALADAILLQCQAFVLQFVFFRPVTTTGMVLLKQFNYYGAGDGPTDYRSPQFYLTIIQNISIFVAFAGLLKFYHAVDTELAWCRPFAKFLCIKGVVFMTFWQGLAISILAETTDVGGEDAEEWAKSAQNFLICLEMLLFSIAHFYCFPTEEWEEGYKIKHSHGFGDTVALGDFVSDIKLILRSNSNPKKKKKKRDQPATIPEAAAEDDDDGDEDTVDISVATSTGETEFDVEQAVAEALEESLGAAGDDPDIIEAKKRLLASKVLSPEHFDIGEGNMNFTFSSDEDDDYVDITENEKVNGGASCTPVHHRAEEQGGKEEEKTEKDDVEPTETTPLRPSIFTTVASLAEQEATAEKKDNRGGGGCGEDEADVKREKTE